MKITENIIRYYMNWIKMKYVMAFVALCLVLFSCSSSKKDIDLNFSKLLMKTQEEIYQIDTINATTEARSYIIAGSSLQMQDRHAEAILEFQEALRYDTTPSIYFAMARSYKALGKMERAMEYTMKTLATDSTFVPAIELLGSIYLTQFRFTDAITIYKHLVELSPTIENKLLLARLYETKEPLEAIKIYESISDDLNFMPLWQRLSELYKITKNSEMYYETIKKIIEVNPSDKNSVYSLLDYYNSLSKYDSSISFIKSLKSIYNPADMISFYNYQSKVFLDDTNHADSPYITKYLQSFNYQTVTDWRLTFLNAYLADKIADSILTLNYINTALKNNDTIAEIPLQAGFFYLSKKSYQKSYEIFSSYIPNFPGDTRFLFYSGVSVSLLDKNREALGFLLAILKINNKHLDALTQLGLCYDRLGIADSSDIYYQKALEIEPMNPLANNNYAYSLSERGVKMEEALKMSEIAVKHEPNNSAYLDTYGWINYKLGKFDIALTYIKSSIEAGNASPDVYEHLGDIYISLGSSSEALINYNKSLKIKPDNDTLRAKIKKLENK